MFFVPTLSLLIVYTGYWLVCRLYGWRATLSPGTFLMFFTFGTVGSVLFALYLEGIPLPLPNETGTLFNSVNPVTWLTGPSIEEVAKILPLLGVVAFFPAARRLGIADFALIGFSTGLGFGFVEANFGQVLSSNISSFGKILAFGYATGTPQAQYLTYTTGHEVQPALVGLALGIGVRFWPDRYWKWLPGAAMLAYCAFDHSMWNFKQQHQYANSADLALPSIETAYRLIMHGYLAVVLLPFGLAVVTFLEGRWSWRAVKSPEAMLLPGESAGLFGEIGLLWNRRKLGPGSLLRSLTYFRHRRAAALAAADAMRASADADIKQFADWSRERLRQELQIVAIAAPSPWLPTRKTCLAITRTVLRRYGMVLLVSLLMILVFGIAPRYLPWLHKGRLAVFIVFAAAAYTAWRIVKFVRAHKPSPQSSDGETLVGYRTRAMMLAASTAAVAAPVLALGFNRQSLLLGALAYIPQYAGGWTQGGGAMEVLMAGGGAATAAQPTSHKPPCESLRREADAGAERVKALEANLNRIIDGASRSGARPVPENWDPGDKPRYYANAGAGGVTNPQAGVAIGRSIPAYQGKPIDWFKFLAGGGLPKPPPGQPGIEDIQRAEAQLDAERAAQEKRVAALNACLDRAATKAEPTTDTPDRLQKDFDDAKRAYDQAQADLNKAMKDAVKSLADFNTAYNDIWNKAIGKLDKYMVDHRPLAAPLAQMWKDLALNDRIKQFAEGVDMLSGAAQLGNGLLKQSLAAEAKAMAPELEGAAGALEGEAANLQKQAATLERQAADAENAAKQELTAAEKENATASGAPPAEGTPKPPDPLNKTNDAAATATDPAFPIRDDAWGKRMADAQTPLTGDQKWAINGYTGSDFKGINGSLRSGDPGKWTDTVAKLDGAMAPINEPVTVFRSTGMGSVGGANADPASLVGKVITDKGFLSTTLQNQTSVASGAVKFEIECPPGTMGRYISPLSNAVSEQEVLLARDTQLVVQSATLSPPGYAPGVWVVKARVVVP